MTRSDADRDNPVSELMLEAGVPGDALLKAALESIAGLSALPAPTPRGELAALLGTPDSGTIPDGGTNPDGDQLAKRRRRKHRPAMFAGAVVAAMGLGVGGVAASGGLEQNPPEFVNQLIAGWAPRENPAPQSLLPAGPVPDAPKVIAVPAPPSLPVPEVAAGARQDTAVPPSAVPNDAPASASMGKSPAKRTEKPSKAKPKKVAPAGKDRRVSKNATLASGVRFGSSRPSFKDSLEAVLEGRGIPAGGTVEDALRRIVRLGIPL